MTSDEKNRPADQSVDDPWADDARGDATGQTSVLNGGPEGQEGLDGPVDVEVKAPRVNYGLLVAAALSGLVVVGGVGYYIKSKWFADSSRPDRPEQAGAVEAPQAQPSRVSETGGLDQVAAGPSPAPQAPAPLDVAPQTPALSTPSKADRAVTAEAKAVEGAAASPGACPCAPSKPESVARPAPRPRPAPVKVAQPPRSTKPPQDPAVSTPAPSSVVASAPRVEIVESAPAMQAAALPAGLRVHAVYPLSGPDAQAWIREPNGRTTVVRAGDLLAGARVTSVVPERGEVHTSSGVIGLGGTR
jgi:hypothetical protein